jgi:phosphatidylserine/phosphatidylglycerophosphate/cardiolipin synthase-like enzyme
MSEASPPLPPAPFVEPLMGSEVAKEIVQCIGAFRLLRSALIVIYTMQDYEFVGHGLVSDLLRRQLALGARITVLTTPPPFSPKKNPYKDKLALLEKLERDGVVVLLNERIHAKVYMFVDSNDQHTVIVGSANLSHGGFGAKSGKTLLEMSLLSNHPDAFRNTQSLVDSAIVADKDTMDFATWRSLNLADIAIAKS